MNGKIYKIIFKPTGNPCYIGRTKRLLRDRFNAHCNSKSSNTKIQQAIRKYGRDKFEIQLIQDNIATVDELQRLETKYIYEYSQKYTLYNTIRPANTYNRYEHLDEKRIHDNNQILCEETSEIFDNKYIACQQYQLNYNQMYKALKNGSPAGHKDNVDLHWRYVDDHLHEQIRRKKYYTIYVVKQLINNSWVPIYVGRTNQPLNRRLSQHLHDNSSALYEVLNQYPIEQFKIETLHNHIETIEKAAQYEFEYTMRLKKTYELYNKNIGNKQDFINKSINKRLTRFTIAEVISNKYFDENQCKECCQCIENDLVFLTYEAASFQYNCQNKDIRNACINNSLIQNVHIQHVDIMSLPKEKDIYINTYNVFQISNVTTKQVYKFYSSKLFVNDFLSYISSGTDVFMKSLLHQISKDNLNIAVVYDNIIFKEEAAYLRKLEQKKYIHTQMKTDKHKLKCLKKKKIHIKSQKVLKNPKLSIAATNTWQDKKIKEKRLQKLASRKPVMCINTGKIFPSYQAAADYYHVHRASIYRVCSGKQKYIKDRQTGEPLYFKDVNGTIPSIKEKTWSIYYVYCDDKIKMVIASKQPINVILPYQKCNHNAPLYKYIQEYGYSHFQVEMKETNIQDKTNAMRIKKEHILRLINSGEQLYSIHV